VVVNSVPPTLNSTKSAGISTNNQFDVIKTVEGRTRKVEPIVSRVFANPKKSEQRKN
jgi:hypothetical protein